MFSQESQFIEDDLENPFVQINQYDHDGNLISERVFLDPAQDWEVPKLPPIEPYDLDVKLLEGKGYSGCVPSPSTPSPRGRFDYNK